MKLNITHLIILISTLSLYGQNALAYSCSEYQAQFVGSGYSQLYDHITNEEKGWVESLIKKTITLDPQIWDKENSRTDATAEKKESITIEGRKDTYAKLFQDFSYKQTSSSKLCPVYISLPQINKKTTKVTKKRDKDFLTNLKNRILNKKSYYIRTDWDVTTPIRLAILDNNGKELHIQDFKLRIFAYQSDEFLNINILIENNHGFFRGQNYFSLQTKNNKSFVEEAVLSLLNVGFNDIESIKNAGSNYFSKNTFDDYLRFIDAPAILKNASTHNSVILSLSGPKNTSNNKTTEIYDVLVLTDKTHMKPPEQTNERFKLPGFNTDTAYQLIEIEIENNGNDNQKPKILKWQSSTPDQTKTENLICTQPYKSVSEKTSLPLSHQYFSEAQILNWSTASFRNKLQHYANENKKDKKIKQFVNNLSAKNIKLSDICIIPTNTPIISARKLTNGSIQFILETGFKITDGNNNLLGHYLITSVIQRTDGPSVYETVQILMHKG